MKPYRPDNNSHTTKDVTIPATERAKMEAIPYANTANIVLVDSCII
jgi:hypothetical protein